MPVGTDFFMAEFKFPQWKPFTFTDSAPQIFYPSFTHHFFPHPDFPISSNAIKEVFWEILALKSLKRFNPTDYEAFYQELLKFEITIDNQSAFVTPEIYQNYLKKRKRDISLKETNLFTTNYILSIFYFLGKLPEYLATLNGNRKKYIENYLMNISFHLKTNSRHPDSEILYTITVLNLLLGK